ncbi:UDP-glycosyltransferase UGT4-like isoform X1 [Cylas formicarius]|uniref:UDP-glycosyltransferase UGT4-like isoform X1 n=1 Tax=Cylas formicarius TaxID=197179 RepID=UPI00295835E4|nr:UDP-glycosyltransferase UGT4-like isoform X1 [Cylas formicarius]
MLISAESVMVATSCLIACLLASAVNGARILGIFMNPSYSHQSYFQPIWKELSLRGHEVTIYTPRPINDPKLVNLTEYNINLSDELHSKKFESEKSNGYTDIFHRLLRYADEQLSHPDVKALIENRDNRTYDLLLVEFLFPSYYALKDLYKVPMVGLASLPPVILNSDILGIEKHPALDPDIMLPFSSTSDLKQRLISWIYNFGFRMVNRLYVEYHVNLQAKKHFGENTRDVRELGREVSLVIADTSFELHNVKPVIPSLVPVSGLHLKPLKPLPDDLEAILNSSDQVIYFSFGTNVRTAEIPKRIVDVVLHAIQQLPYTVLWKYDGDELPQNISSNVHIRKWFPQQDVLAHPKVKLFVTQGGLQSIEEAVYYQVPLLVVPFYSDQKYNAHRLTSLGVAETALPHTSTKEEISSKIKKILGNPKYKENMEHISSIFLDEPMKPIDKAIWWIEYVLRHKGAEHLKYGAVGMPFYQYYMLDVYATLILAVVVLYHICRRIYRLLFRNAIYPLIGLVYRLIFKRTLSETEKKHQ